MVPLFMLLALAFGSAHMSFPWWLWGLAALILYVKYGEVR